MDSLSQLLPTVLSQTGGKCTITIEFNNGPVRPPNENSGDNAQMVPPPRNNRGESRTGTEPDSLAHDESRADQHFGSKMSSGSQNVAAMQPHQPATPGSTHGALTHEAPQRPESPSSSAERSTHELRQDPGHNAPKTGTGNIEHEVKPKGRMTLRTYFEQGSKMPERFENKREPGGQQPERTRELRQHDHTRELRQHDHTRELRQHDHATMRYRNVANHAPFEKSKYEPTGLLSDPTSVSGREPDRSRSPQSSINDFFYSGVARAHEGPRRKPELRQPRDGHVRQHGRPRSRSSGRYRSLEHNGCADSQKATYANSSHRTRSPRNCFSGNEHTHHGSSNRNPGETRFDAFGHKKIDRTSSTSRWADGTKFGSKVDAPFGSKVDAPFGSKVDAPVREPTITEMVNAAPSYLSLSDINGENDHCGRLSRHSVIGGQKTAWQWKASKEGWYDDELCTLCIKKVGQEVLRTRAQPKRKVATVDRSGVQVNTKMMRAFDDSGQSPDIEGSLNEKRDGDAQDYEGDEDDPAWTKEQMCKICGKCNTGGAGRPTVDNDGHHHTHAANRLGSDLVSNAGTLHKKAESVAKAIKRSGITEHKREVLRDIATELRTEAGRIDTLADKAPAAKLPEKFAGDPTELERVMKDPRRVFPTEEEDVARDCDGRTGCDCEKCAKSRQATSRIRDEDVQECKRSRDCTCDDCQRSPVADNDNDDSKRLPAQVASIMREAGIDGTWQDWMVWEKDGGEVWKVKCKPCNKFLSFDHVCHPQHRQKIAAHTQQGTELEIEKVTDAGTTPQLIASECTHRRNCMCRDCY